MSDIKTTAFCSKCGRMTCGSATNDNCHWCGAEIEYIYVEPNQEVKIIMQLQEKIAELQAKYDKKCAEYLDVLNKNTDLANSYAEEVSKNVDLESEVKALRLIAGSHSMSELRRNKIMAGDKWFKYPEAPRGEQ